MGKQNYTSIARLLSQKPAQKQQASSPGSKETQPPTSIKKSEQKTIELHEVVEHQPPDDLKKYLNHRPEMVSVDENLARLGVEPVGTPTFSAYRTVTFSISDEKIFYGLRAPLTSSLRWLSTLAWYVLKKTHLTLRRIHGKVVRVIIR